MSRRERLTAALRSLDATLVPAAARLLRRVRPGPDGLAGLDRRWARGPLAVVRDLPQVGMLVIAVVFLAGTTVVLVDRRSEPVSAATATPEAGPPAPPRDDRLADLGPTPGQESAEYLVAARARLDGAVPGPGPFLALVSLAAPLTADGVAAALGPAGLVGVVLQVPLAGGTPTASLLPVTDPAAVPGAFQARAATRRADAAELVTVAATVGADPAEAEAKALFEREAALATAEADQLAAGCACVVALLVQGPGAALAAVTAAPGVRAVDPSRAGALVPADVRLLPPGLEGPVPPVPVQRG